MPHNDTFDSLTHNAFDFLERGIADFDEAPKYSVIHFCAAVEMLLKARLMKEHWSLIVSRPDRAKRTDFMAGNFISVTLEGAIARIRDIAGEEISNDACTSFRTLANHRNKMVHFFHQGLEHDEKAKAQIVAEQCRSWFHLHRLLIRWDGHFSDFSSQIIHADQAMKEHREYLAAKFKALKPELDAARKTGNPLKACGACGFKAGIPDAIDDQIATLRCLVCDHTEIQVDIDCPHCGEPIVVANEGYARCGHCEGAIEPEHLVDALTDHDAAYIAMKDGDDSWGCVNCGDCEGYHTVVRLDEHYFCASCFNVSDSISQCEWCGEMDTGDMENSYAIGCSHCDGKAGWERDA